MRRTLARLIVVGVIFVGWSTSSAAQQPAPLVTWQSAGDSYSSGEGVFGNEGDCSQSTNAYGPTAQRQLAGSWSFASVTFTACSGHQVEDFFVARGDKESLWEWGLSQGGPDRVDILTMSFGGNDIGFGGLLKDCLDIPIAGDWNDFIQVGSIRTGCDTSEQEVQDRIDSLLDPPQTCSGTRPGGTAGFDCDLDLGGRRGSLIDFYVDIVTDRLTDRGNLYIVGYPRLVAPVAEWPGWIKVDCQRILRGDSERLGRLAEYFDQKLREAVHRANDQLGGERVYFVDRLDDFRSNKAELCGTNEDWINGIAVDRGEGPNFRPQSSFHINAAGHARTGAQLAALVAATFDPMLPASARRFVDGVSYEPPLSGNWTEADLGEPGVVYLMGNSSFRIEFLAGRQIDSMISSNQSEYERRVAEGWWDEVPDWMSAATVPGADRAVRYFPVRSETGDGIQESLMVEVANVTVRASTYLYIEDLDVFAPGDLEHFLESIEIARSDIPDLSLQGETRVGLAHCSPGGVVLFGGTTELGFDIAVCIDRTGTLEYHGIEPETLLEIRLPACELSPGLYAALNLDTLYRVDAGRGTAQSSDISIFDASGDRFFIDIFTGVVGIQASGNRCPPEVSSHPVFKG